ncbi:hypothetical protein PCURB6_27220 [Paenibacillus curdlanolyticus]|nr:hypothetical protein PCURB6_27220 [Paenibacillus curdlanolyticus]
MFATRQRGSNTTYGCNQASVYAPTRKGKSKGYHRMKFEVWIPEDAIVGEDALTDFGIVTLMRLPKNRVAEHLRHE